MKKFLCIWGRAVALVLVFCTFATAEIFKGSYPDTTKIYKLYEDSVVLQNTDIGFAAFAIKESLRFENYGVIHSDIIIDPGKVLFLKNSGSISGTIKISDNAHLTQIVNGVNDLHSVNVARGIDSSFEIFADGATGLDFMDLVNMSRNADKIVIKDSILNFKIGDASSVPIELLDENVFKIKNISGSSDIVLLSNVSGDGVIFVESDASNLFYTETERTGKQIILKIKRETDFGKTVGGTRGQFLNTVRAAGSNTSLINRLDAVQSNAELNIIMDSSVMFNPVRLMEPLKIMSRFSHPGGFGSSGAGVGMTTIFGPGISLYAGDIGADFSTNNFIFGIHGFAGYYAGDRAWSDDSGTFYGAAPYITFMYNGFYLMSLSQINFVKFDTIQPIFDEKGPVYDPTGISFYSALEFGGRVYDDVIYVTPMLRTSIWYAKVLDSTDTEFIPGGGVRIGTITEYMGIKTDYSVYGIVDAVSSQFGGRMDVLLGGDDMAFGIDIAALQSEDDWFYKASANIKFLF